MLPGATTFPGEDSFPGPFDHEPYTITLMDADIAAGAQVKWAHRGGSANWSEMTEHAYDNALLSGVRCLEFSAQRDSEGVWWGLYDATLDRVTALTGNIASKTTAELTDLAVDTPSGGGVLMRLEDFLGRYGDFVLIVDNRPGTFWTEEFYPLLKAVPNWEDHVIVNIDGTAGGSSASRFSEAQGEGFRTAGYWYPDSTGMNLLAIKAAYTDYIGMQWDATDAQWLTVQSYGKPSWGFVIGTDTQYDEAHMGGADIFELADVAGLAEYTSDAVLAASGTLARTGSGTVVVTGVPSGRATIARTGSGSLVVTGRPGAAGAVTLSGGGLMLTLDRVPNAAGAAGLSGLGSLSIAAAGEGVGVVQRSGSGALVVTGVAMTVAAPVVLTGSGGLAVAATAERFGSLARTGSGSLVVTGYRSGTVTGTALLTGAGTLVVIGHPGLPPGVPPRMPVIVGPYRKTSA